MVVQPEPVSVDEGLSAKFYCKLMEAADEGKAIRYQRVFGFWNIWFGIQNSNAGVNLKRGPTLLRGRKILTLFRCRGLRSIICCYSEAVMFFLNNCVKRYLLG